MFRKLASLLLFPFLMFACGGQDPAVALQVGNAEIGVPLVIGDITQVTATITAPDIVPDIVGNLAIVGDTASALFAGVPAGAARSVTVEAFVGATLVCSGATSIDVLAGAKVTATVLLECDADEVERGELEVVGEFNFSPVIESVIASPSTIPAGGLVDLAVTAFDQDGDPLDYLWSATDGTFSDPTVPVTQWTAPLVAGSYTIEIAVSDDSRTVTVVIIIIVI
jgi:hypothetical protein